MRAVCYPRVSSAAQRERHTIESQLRELPAFVERLGAELVRPAEYYMDDGRSARAGKLEARPGLAALLRDAALGLFDVVAVVDIDRLTRSEKLAERYIILGALQDAGVRVADMTSGQVLDLDTDQGDLMASFKGYLAAAESRIKSERVRRGKLTAAQRGGKATGRNPYGLDYTKPSSWSINEPQAAIARELVRRVADGESCYALADDLNARGVPWIGPTGRWSRGRVYDLVRSRHLVGEYIAHAATRTIVAVPAIVDETVWQAAQDQLAANRKAPLRKTKHVYLLEALAVCGACGGRMMVQSGCYVKGGRFYRPAFYICERRKYVKVGPDRCTAPKVRVDQADDRAWRAIRRELEDPALVPALVAERSSRASDAHDWQADADGYRAHLARLDKVADAVLARFRRGTLTEADLDRELAALNRERAAVRAQLRTAERATQGTISAQGRAYAASAMIERLLARAAAATPEQRVEIVRVFVDPGGVVLHGDRIRLDLWIPRPSADAGSGALVTAGVYSDGCESRLRIRLVA